MVIGSRAMTPWFDILNVCGVGMKAIWNCNTQKATGLKILVTLARCLTSFFLGKVLPDVFS